MKYEECPKCGEEAVHLARADVQEFYGDREDSEGERSKWADDLAPDNELAVTLFAHICFSCGFLVNVDIERPRDKARDGAEDEG